MSVLVGKALSTPIAIGQRIRFIRTNLLDLSRPEFGDKTGIAAPTLKIWELGHGGGPSQTYLLKLVEALEQLGLFCSLPWLMYGIGPKATMNKESIAFTAEDQLIAEEIALFREHTPFQTMDLLVSDMGLYPLVMPSSYVAGIVVQDPQKALNQPCIILTESGMLVTRVLKPGIDQGQFSLVCYSKDHFGLPSIDNVKVLSVAPITLIRHKSVLADSELATQMN